MEVHDDADAIVVQRDGGADLDGVVVHYPQFVNDPASDRGTGFVAGARPSVSGRRSELRDVVDGGVELERVDFAEATYPWKAGVGGDDAESRGAVADAQHGAELGEALR